MAGVLSLLLLLVAIVAGIVVTCVVGPSLGGPAVVVAVLGVFLVVTWVVGRSLDGLLDRHFLGLRAVAMSKNVQMITLRFRDAGMAATVAQLTERRCATQVAAAKQVLGGP